MADLNVVALITAKPGQESVVRDALDTLVGHTREEEGCLAYDLFESTAEPGTFVTIERWTGQDALDQHMASDHIAAAFATAGDAMSVQPAIHTLSPV